jgi:hypothetical protein
MNYKKGVCIECKEEKYIYSKKKCQYCYWNTKDKKPIKKKAYKIAPISKKMAKKLADYRPLRDKYMKLNPICEFDGCKKPSEDLHHKARRGENLCNVETFMAVCRKHHIWIEENHELSLELGYLRKK